MHCPLLPTLRIKYLNINCCGFKKVSNPTVDVVRRTGSHVMFGRTHVAEWHWSFFVCLRTGSRLKDLNLRSRKMGQPASNLFWGSPP